MKRAIQKSMMKSPWDLNIYAEIPGKFRLNELLRIIAEILKKDISVDEVMR